MAKALKSSSELTRRGRTAFSYKGIESTTNRRNPITRTTPEVVHLTGAKRQTASGTIRDDRRNFTILAWMIRKHLDNVSRFTPFVRTGDDKVDAIAKKCLRWHGMRRNFDAIGRHGRDEFMRMFESCKVISGDAGALKVKGGKLQGIEGDRLAIPGGATGEYTAADKTVFGEEGLAFTGDGSRKAWCLCKRSGVRGEQLVYERTIPAEDLFFDGYWPERFDANRGVSPIITALNDATDVRESWEWIVLKIKQSGLFGIGFTRQGADPISPIQNAESDDESEPETKEESYTQQLSRAIQARGLINLDLDPGDDFKEFESKTPYPAAVEFTRELVRAILLALDIPFTFYDSLTASFSARVADRNEYEEACEWKRDKNIGVLDEIYGGWLFPLWAQIDLFGIGKALAAASIDVENLAASVHWMPAGKPWLDRTNEMSGHILALAAGVTSVPRICAMYGDDAYAIAKEQKEFLEKSGIPLLYAQGGQVSVQEIMKGQMNGNDKAK